MVSVLIVDDEKNIRAGIRKILGESIPGALEFYEARNGEEGLESILKKRPDLLISDIRMPRMDGLELMRRVAALELPPQIIVLSGYDDFSYAKQAMASGASSYILKPVDRDELITVVGAKIHEIERNERLSVEAELRDILGEGHLSRRTDGRPLVLEFPLRFAITDNRLPLEAAFDAFIAQHCFIIEKKPDSLFFAVAESLADDCLALARANPSATGFSGTCATLTDLRRSTRHASIAFLCHLFARSSERARSFERDLNLFLWDDRETSQPPISVEAKVVKLNTLFGSTDCDAVIAAVDDLFAQIQGGLWQRAAALHDLHDLVVTLLVRKNWEVVSSDPYLFVKALMLENLNGFRTFDEYHRCVIDLSVYLNSLLRQNRMAYPFIDQAITFIQENFRRDINMTVVANHVSVNYTYFSEKFKEQTGVNFNEYLKTLRIEEAKHLLEKGCHKVYEVAAASGFGDVKYFMKTFKDALGLSPGEYRKKFDNAAQEEQACQ